jgi:hypothetical protein
MKKLLFIITSVLSMLSAQTNLNNLLNIPERGENAVEGSVFMESIKNLSFADRENAIKNELLSGNVPQHQRNLVEINAQFYDLNNNLHQIKYWVMPDYISIGSDSDFCRVPMGPITAQTVADWFNATMPTRKLVDNIYQNASVKLAPVPYAPVGNENEKVYKFIQHNNDIQTQFNNANGELGELIGGTKKDVVISNKIVDPNRPNHVTIYGWHQLNGQPIQPLTNIHYNYYVDYSHGIRFLYSKVLVDGDTMNVRDILKDNILYKILSDESGVMYQPTYLIDENLPNKPRSFGLKSELENEIKILLDTEPNVDKYHVYVSNDGINFDSLYSFYDEEYTFNTENSDSIIYVKLIAENSIGKSQASEILAVIPKPSDKKMLIVNGFDRSSDGNSYDFVIEHGKAAHYNNVVFESASNEAITNRLFELTDYEYVDFILGDESTADESLSYQEQILVANYLEKGGRLFISGSEIAWDLDYKGNSSDKYFIENYLKAKYSADAPGGISGTYYSAEGITGDIFEDFTTINFDNGTHGTINVNYADALIPDQNAEAVLNYKNVTNHKAAGIKYEGLIGNGSFPAKVIYFGFPFETVYLEETRNQLMTEIIDFFNKPVTSIDNEIVEFPNQFVLFQNYPNPFNPSTSIEYIVPSNEYVTLSVFDILGNKIADLVDEQQSAGKYSVTFDAGSLSNRNSQLSSGIYIYRLQAGSFSKSKTMILLK